MRRVTAAGLFMAILPYSATADPLPPAGRVYTYHGPPTVQLYTWSGLYVGAHAGGAWNDTAGTDDNNAGFIGGAHVGFNLRSGRTVFGVEGQWSGIGTGGDNDNGGSLTVFPGGVTGSFETEVDWLATLTGRVGIAWDRSLFYLKGGAAWVRNTYDVSLPLPGPRFSGSETRVGWALGLGYEYAFRNAWSTRLEYMFMDFGSDTVRLDGPAGGLVVSEVDQQVHALTLSLNYRFDWPMGGPLGTPY